MAHTPTTVEHLVTFNEAFSDHRPVTRHPSSDIWYVRSRQGRGVSRRSEEHARRIVEALGLVFAVVSG